MDFPKTLAGRIALKRRISRLRRWAGDPAGPCCGYAKAAIIQGERERERRRDRTPRSD